MIKVFISSLHYMRWRGFPVLVVPSIAWEIASTGWVACCRTDQRLDLVVAIRGMAPLVPPITTGDCRSYSTDCPVPKNPAQVFCCIPEAVPEARLTLLSIIMGVVHCIPLARLMDGLGWGLDFRN